MNSQLEQELEMAIRERDNARAAHSQMSGELVAIRGDLKRAAKRIEILEHAIAMHGSTELLNYLRSLDRSTSQPNKTSSDNPLMSGETKS